MPYNEYLMETSLRELDPEIAEIMVSDAYMPLFNTITNPSFFSASRSSVNASPFSLLPPRTSHPAQFSMP